MAPDPQGRGTGPAASALPVRLPTEDWMALAEVKLYRKGQSIVRAGETVPDWIAISRGSVCLNSLVAQSASIAVATLWLGDVIGWGSPITSGGTQYEVTALTDVSTIVVPSRQVPPTQCGSGTNDVEQLYRSTAGRIQRQVTMRLAGNGVQRLVSVLSTLAHGFVLAAGPADRLGRLALPISQDCIGQLSGLSRRQAWIYLGQLAEAGWVQTSRTKITLEGLASWLGLLAEVEARGLDCIATIARCSTTLTDLHLARSAPSRITA